MSENLVQIGEVEPRYSTSSYRILGYQVSLYHSGLNEHKLISAPEKYLLESKVNNQIQKWDERWNKEVSIEYASIRTTEAHEALEEIENLLLHTLSVDDTIEWHKLKDRRKFNEKILLNF